MSSCDMRRTSSFVSGGAAVTGGETTSVGRRVGCAKNAPYCALRGVSSASGVGDFVAVKRAFVGVEGKQQQIQRVRVCPGALQGSAKIRMARLLVLFRLHLLTIGIKLPPSARQFLAGAVTGMARLVARLCHFGKRRPDAFELRRLAACGIALLPKRVDGFRVSGNDAFRRIRRNLQFL